MPAVERGLIHRIGSDEQHHVCRRRRWSARGKEDSTGHSRRAVALPGGWGRQTARVSLPCFACSLRRGPPREGAGMQVNELASSSIVVARLHRRATGRPTDGERGKGSERGASGALILRQKAISLIHSLAFTAAAAAGGGQYGQTPLHLAGIAVCPREGGSGRGRWWRDASSPSPAAACAPPRRPVSTNERRNQQYGRREGGKERVACGSSASGGGRK